VQGAEAVGPPAGRGQLRDGQRRRRGRDHGLRWEHLAQAAVDVALHLGVLGDGLDHHVTLAELGEIGHHAGVLNPLAGTLGGALAARPYHHLVVLGRRSGQPAGDRPATYDSK
jgi:hypothetical protein